MDICEVTCESRIEILAANSGYHLRQTSIHTIYNTYGWSKEVVLKYSSTIKSDSEYQ